MLLGCIAIGIRMIWINLDKFDKDKFDSEKLKELKRALVTTRQIYR